MVATEVRNLAQRSSAASREIRELIEASLLRVDAGRRLAGEAHLTMNDIIGSVHGVGTIMREIALASREQDTGIVQVNAAVGQMDQVTQQNAALVEQAAAAAASLRDQTQSVVGALTVFKLNTGATAMKAPAHRRQAPRRMPAPAARRLPA